jgi:hypothetical protein
MAGDVAARQRLLELARDRLTRHALEAASRRTFAPGRCRPLW